MKHIPSIAATCSGVYIWHLMYNEKSVRLYKGSIVHASPMHSILVQHAADTEVGRLKLFEGDILLVEGESNRKRRSDIMTSSGQEANMMGMGDTVEYDHTWPNRTVYFVFGQTLGELLFAQKLGKNLVQVQY